ncbi:MAG TPA: DUF3800 domain-containing protein [Bryobacteraceae bacterium]|jgi:hypothetical protein|nr:DUF3800 domain-containing protein [Bryobacteraceae bacterium]
MPLKGYYDGSGKSDDKNCRLLTLAGYCGEGSEWDAFRHAWIEILKKHNAPEEHGDPYMHMVDATSLNKGFSKTHGWTKPKVGQLVLDLFRVLRDFGFDRLRGVCCPVALSDWRRAASQFKHPFPDSAESLCVELCIRNTVIINPNDAGKPKIVQLYFDRGEDFMKKIYRTWTNAPESKRQGWQRQTESIGTVTRLCPGVQAADVIAWITNKHFTDGTDAEYEMWYQLLVPALVRKPKQPYGYDDILPFMKENSPED